MLTFLVDAAHAMGAPSGEGGGNAFVSLWPFIIIIGIIVVVVIWQKKKSETEDDGALDSSSINKVVRLNFMGGIIGFLTNDPHKALQKRVLQENKNGWRVVQVIPDISGNLFVYLLRILLLIITLFLYTQANGYFILFEKNIDRPEK